MITMPFGKYRGTPLEDLPGDYLIWLGSLDELREPLLGAVLREMGRRMGFDQTSAPTEGARR